VGGARALSRPRALLRALALAFTPPPLSPRARTDPSLPQ
jgi:hypothetical protein